MSFLLSFAQKFLRVYEPVKSCYKQSLDTQFKLDTSGFMDVAFFLNLFLLIEG